MHRKVGLCELIVFLLLITDVTNENSLPSFVGSYTARAHRFSFFICNQIVTPHGKTYAHVPNITHH
jgi:hypothetical protein